MIEPVDIADLYPRPSGWRKLWTVELDTRLAPSVATYPESQPREEPIYTTGRDPELAIDFGTSAITAALVGGHYDFEPLLFDGQALLEAPIGWRPDLGRATLSENYELNFVPSYLAPGQKQPVWEYSPCLKRRIEWLARCSAGTEWRRSAVLDVAAVCCLAVGRARDERGRTVAERLRGKTFRVFITVPNAFPRTAIDVLRAGVRYGVAGALGSSSLPRVSALLEAEAVAYGVIAKPSLNDQPIDSTVLVIDAGAGTTDASIVRARDGNLQVVAHVGLPVGGLDLDAYIASLQGPFEELDPFEISRRLLVSREQKQSHLGERAEDGPGNATNAGGELRRSFEELAEVLSSRNYGWPKQVPGPGGSELADRLGEGYQRYMAFAVDALVQSLPAEELAAVDQLVISGRASLLKGFQAAVRRSLDHRGSDLEPMAATGSEQRKLAVIQGVGAFVASVYSSQWERRPVRASFEIVLRYGGHRELTLLPAGTPLLEGWGAEAWHHPTLDGARDTSRAAVEMRLVPRTVLRDLVHAGSFPEAEVEELLRWSAMPLLRIEGKRTPYSACVTFDFLSFEAWLKVDGRRVKVVEHPVETSFGRRHPIHRLREDWFEIFHRGKR